MPEYHPEPGDDLYPDGYEDEPDFSGDECPLCLGDGYIDDEDDRCHNCNGTGYLDD